MQQTWVWARRNFLPVTKITHTSENLECCRIIKCQHWVLMEKPEKQFATWKMWLVAWFTNRFAKAFLKQGIKEHNAMFGNYVSLHFSFWLKLLQHSTATQTEYSLLIGIREFTATSNRSDQRPFSRLHPWHALLYDGWNTTYFGPQYLFHNPLRRRVISNADHTCKNSVGILFLFLKYTLNIYFSGTSESGNCIILWEDGIKNYCVY